MDSSLTDKSSHAAERHNGDSCVALYAIVGDEAQRLEFLSVETLSRLCKARLISFQVLDDHRFSGTRSLAAFLRNPSPVARICRIKHRLIATTAAGRKARWHGEIVSRPLIKPIAAIGTLLCGAKGWRVEPEIHVYEDAINLPTQSGLTVRNNYVVSDLVADVRGHVDSRLLADAWS